MPKYILLDTPEKIIAAYDKRISQGYGPAAAQDDVAHKVNQTTDRTTLEAKTIIYKARA